MLMILPSAKGFLLYVAVSTLACNRGVWGFTVNSISPSPNRVVSLHANVDRVLAEQYYFIDETVAVPNAEALANQKIVELNEEIAGLRALQSNVRDTPWMATEEFSGDWKTWYQAATEKYYELEKMYAEEMQGLVLNFQEVRGKLDVLTAQGRVTETLLKQAKTETTAIQSTLNALRQQHVEELQNMLSQLDQEQAARAEERDRAVAELQRVISQSVDDIQLVQKVAAIELDITSTELNLKLDAANTDNEQLRQQHVEELQGMLSQLEQEQAARAEERDRDVAELQRVKSLSVDDMQLVQEAAAIELDITSTELNLKLDAANTDNEQLRTVLKSTEEQREERSDRITLLEDEKISLRTTSTELNLKLDATNTENEHLRTVLKSTEEQRDERSDRVVLLEHEKLSLRSMARTSLGLVKRRVSGNLGKIGSKLPGRRQQQQQQPTPPQRSTTTGTTAQTVSVRKQHNVDILVH